MTQSVLGIVGGSGFYNLPGLAHAEWRAISSPWGQPSDDVLFAELDGLPVRFLPRHGRGHKLPPERDQLPGEPRCAQRAGVTDLVSVSACGSLKKKYRPGDFVLPDQYIDRTFRRETSFFGTGCVAHVAMGDPISPLLFKALERAAKNEKIKVHRGGVYLAMEGPQFSTRAESNLYRSWGADVIGMTNMPEAKLAREAEICYASVAMVTDYDCWHSDHADVDVAAILEVMKENTCKAQQLVARLARDFPREHPLCPIGSDRALEVAIITPPEARDAEVLKKLDAIAARVLG